MKSFKLDDLDIICVAVGCTIADLLIAEPEHGSKPGAGQGKTAVAIGAGTAAVVPQRRDGRSLPPV